jgi:serine protease AprX
VARRPDLVAPGKSVVSLRVPGSFADVAHPEGLVVGDKSARLFRGTGTSQSSAVVSGAVALLLERNPALTPDQVKGLLKANADPLTGDPSAVQGAGEIDINRAVVQLEAGKAIPAYTQTAAHSTGLGSLDASRGASYVTDPSTLVTLRGEQDVFGVAWNPATWAPAATAGTAWVGNTWRGSAWITTPALVASTALASTTTTTTATTGWASRSWSGTLWSSRSWSTMSFLSGAWTGSDWASRSWSANDWDSRSWSTDYAW